MIEVSVKDESGNTFATVVPKRDKAVSGDGFVESYFVALSRTQLTPSECRELGNVLGSIAK